MSRAIARKNTLIILLILQDQDSGSYRPEFRKTGLPLR